MAATAGVSREALRSSPWRRILRNVWTHESLPDDRQSRLAAVRLVLPPYAVLCGATAAWIYGADIRRTDELDIHVSFPPGQRRRPRTGLVVSQETLTPGDLWRLGDLGITSPLRTAFDCLRLLRPPDGLVVADALIRERRLSIDELAAYFASKRRLRNLRIGEQLVDLVEPLSESPMETRMRWELHRDGLPRPVAQYEVYAGDQFVVRLDLAYPDHKVGVEYDGAWHWDQRRHDDRRRERLRELGWTILVFSAEDVLRTPEQMSSAVRRALTRAARAG